MQIPDRSNSQPGFLTYAQLVVSGLGLLGAVLGTGVLFLVGLIVLFGDTADPADTVAAFSLLWIGVLTIGLTLFSVVFSLQRLQKIRFKLPRISGFRWAVFLILLWPAVLGLGHLAVGLDRLAWLVFPPLQILAVVLPVWWLVSLVQGQPPKRSPQRTWGIANFSLLITTPLITAVEIIVFGFLLILFVVYVIGQPELVNELQRLGQRLSVPQPDPNVILPLLRPYLQNPIVIFAILAILSGLVPLIEELLKPLALWSLAGRWLTPAEGFAGGAICGGTFAVYESLLSLASSGQEGWVTLVVGRAGTGLLHITTSALLGWAMASAWKHGTYLRLGLVYLLSCAIHGVWNAFSVLTGMSVFLDAEIAGLKFLSGLVKIAPVLLVVLVVIMFGLLLGIQHRLRKEPLPVTPVPIDPLQSV